MRTGIVLLLVCMGIVAGPAAAESPGFMGIYFDAEATTYDLFTSPGVVETYVCLIEAPFAQIEGFDFQFEIEGNALVTDAIFPGDEATVLQTGGGYYFDLQQSLAVEPVTVLARLSLFVLDASASYLTLSGLETNPWTALDLPNVYLPDGSVQPVCTAAWNSELGEPDYCATINDFIIILPGKSYECFGLVAAEKQTWDAVKSMYR